MPSDRDAEVAREAFDVFWNGDPDDASSYGSWEEHEASHEDWERIARWHLTALRKAREDVEQKWQRAMLPFVDPSADGVDPATITPEEVGREVFATLKMTEDDAREEARAGAVEESERVAHDYEVLSAEEIEAKYGTGHCPIAIRALRAPGSEEK